MSKQEKLLDTISEAGMHGNLAGETLAKLFKLRLKENKLKTSIFIIVMLFMIITIILCILVMWIDIPMVYPMITSIIEGIAAMIMIYLSKDNSDFSMDKKDENHTPNELGKAFEDEDDKENFIYISIKNHGKTREEAEGLYDEYLEWNIHEGNLNYLMINNFIKKK